MVYEGTKSLFPQAQDPRDLAKIDNALKYARAMVEAGENALIDRIAPIELRKFYIGPSSKVTPPFPHGDDF